MINSILNTIVQKAGSGIVNKIASSVGIDSSTAQSLMNKALPMILGQLSKNTESAGGAQALAGALLKHNASGLDVDKLDIGEGSKILGHIFGGKEKVVEQALGAAEGLDAGQVQQGLSMMAPLVMGALGQQQDDDGLDADGIQSLLAHTKQELEDDDEVETSLMSSLLDQDGDGSSTDDLLSMGQGLLGKMLK